jgi:hypothetical protein
MVPCQNQGRTRFDASCNCPKYRLLCFISWQMVQHSYEGGGIEYGIVRQLFHAA